MSGTTTQTSSSRSSTTCRAGKQAGFMPTCQHLQRTEPPQGAWSARRLNDVPVIFDHSCDHSCRPCRPHRSPSRSRRSRPTDDHCRPPSAPLPGSATSLGVQLGRLRPADHLQARDTAFSGPASRWVSSSSALRVGALGGRGALAPAVGDQRCTAELC